MHRFGRRNAQDDGLVLGQVTYRDTVHYRRVGGDVLRHHLPQIVPKRVIHRLPISDSVIVQICKAPNQHAPDTVKDPRQPESQQHPVHVVEVLIQILQQQPRALNRWKVGRAEQAVQHR